MGFYKITFLCLLLSQNYWSELVTQRGEGRETEAGITGSVVVTMAESARE
jgi:hypothetical protein